MGEDACLSSDLGRFFYPSSIAVIGASSNPAKLGFKLVHNIRTGGYEGRLYPVNINGGEVDGIPSVRSLEEIEEDVDLAMISLPSSMVKGALEEVGKKRIPFAIIVSAGFRESGDQEAELELLGTAKKYGVRILGPNVFGIIYTPSKLNAQFGPGDVTRGKVAIITQSGALGAALMGKVFEEGIGVSGVVSTGNKADISDEELLEFFCSDPNTEAVLMYIEGLKDGRRFMKIVSGVSRVKPIILVKSGTTEEGARAVLSHTASLAGSDRVFDGAFKQAGVLRAPTIKDAIDWTRTLIDLPRPKRKEVLIITNGGGLGAIAVDWLTKGGIPLFRDLEWIEREMGPIFPPYATMDNPVDITAQVPWNVYLKGLRRAMEEDHIGSVIGIYSPTSGADVDAFTQGIVETIGRPKKPVMIVTFGGSSSIKQIQDLKKNLIPAFYYPEEAVASLVTLYRYAELSERAGGMKVQGNGTVIGGLDEEPPGPLRIEKAMEIVEGAGISTPRWRVLSQKEELLEAVRETGYPLVLKTADREIVHKTGSRGVYTDVRTVDEASSVFDMLKGISSKIMVMEQVQGFELIVGGSKDPVFGPVVMFGLGGVMVEVLEDVQFRVAPLSKKDALDMISSVKGAKVLEGFRGSGKVDMESLSETLVRIGEVLLGNGRMKEIEINPLIASEKSLKAVDVRVILS